MLLLLFSSYTPTKGENMQRIILSKNIKRNLEISIDSYWILTEQKGELNVYL